MLWRPPRAPGGLTAIPQTPYSWNSGRGRDRQGEKEMERTTREGRRKSGKEE